MIKEQFTSFKNLKRIQNSENSMTFVTEDGRILKRPSAEYLRLCELYDINLEQKLISTRADSVKEIIPVLSIVYYYNCFDSYTTPLIKGTCLLEYEYSLDLKEHSNLMRYFDLYMKIENAVKKANANGIVLPDLGTSGNIFITPNEEIKFLDRDGMQFGPHDRALGVSTILGSEEKLEEYTESSRFVCGINRYKDEIDKATLAALLLKYTFTISVREIDEKYPNDNRSLIIAQILRQIGITDEIFISKIVANLSLDRNDKGSYLGEDFYRIATNYDMIAEEKGIVKKLIKK